MSVTLHTTLGPLKIELFVEACPKTCENFLALAASGYFDDVPFHRNLAGFITQTGDGELKTGKGGKSIWGGFFEDEISPALRHNARGIVSMANKGENTNASQFFVTYAAQKHLDGRNTVFGKVIDGADTTLTKIEEVEVDKKNRPKTPVKIQKVTIHANPLADMDPGQ
ncbi:cyclophilin-like domain-containing protein [Pyronema domesticum]|uniref:Peptidyl-prolyl cis-trans isomerase n=1 Tax=Pyronema omphalodes (strain CBS 100304) TaxID=1076935 RepID=U4LM77_PYROM|nr:cyclophilin-like domain-containing protein [Pyronema domesticum]CCX33043.1 Similar to Peptidyl-prolyl cis-trans isomerase-like 3; acc. no. P0C1I5 [Pyronema omphalodes CBS 100304]